MIIRTWEAGLKEKKEWGSRRAPHRKKDFRDTKFQLDGEGGTKKQLMKTTETSGMEKREEKKQEGRAGGEVG